MALPPIRFRFQLGEKVSIVEIDYDDQHAEGYQITQRCIRRGRPAYRLAGASFESRNYSNVFYQDELMYPEELQAVIYEMGLPWPEVEGDSIDPVNLSLPNGHVDNKENI